MDRIINVFSTQTNDKKEIKGSTATTWGQLKAEVERLGFSTSSMKVIVRESRVTLEDAGAQLPEGSFTLFLMPTKVKSGK